MQNFKKKEAMDDCFQTCFLRIHFAHITLTAMREATFFYFLDYVVKVKTCHQLKDADGIFQLVKRCFPRQKMPPCEIKTYIKNELKS